MIQRTHEAQYTPENTHQDFQRGGFSKAREEINVNLKLD
jgi:hypothetical protein